MAAVDGETPACLTRMAEKAIVSAPVTASARGRAARAVTTAGIAGAVLGATRLRVVLGQVVNVQALAQRCRRRPVLRPVADRTPTERAGHAAAGADLQGAVRGPAHVHGARDRPAARGQRAADAQAGDEGVAAQAQASLEAGLRREA